MSLIGILDRLQAKRKATVLRRLASRAWPERKDEFIEELNRRLETLIEGVSVLQEGAFRRTRCAQFGRRERLTELRQRARQLQRALEVYAQEDGYAWLHFRFRAEGRWEDLDQDFSRSLERYQELSPTIPGDSQIQSEGMPTGSRRPTL